MIECPGCGGYNVLQFGDSECPTFECWECGEAWDCDEDGRIDVDDETIESL